MFEYIGLQAMVGLLAGGLCLTRVALLVAVTVILPILLTIAVLTISGVALAISSVALSVSTTVLVVPVEAATLAEVAQGCKLELPKTFVIVQKHVHLVGQLQGKALNPGRLGAVHHYSSRRLVHRCHQLIIDDHLANLTVNSGGFHIEHLSQCVNRNRIIDKTVKKSLKMPLVKK